MASRVQLPSLTVEGFRGIRSLEIPSLGRVTLLAGKNSVGKTTILDAIRVFASRGESRNLVDLLGDREEVVSGNDEDGDTVGFPHFESLFHDYDSGNGEDTPSTIRIAAGLASSSLSLELVESEEGSGLSREDLALEEVRVSVGERSRTIPLSQIDHIRNRRRPVSYTRGRASQKPDAWPNPIVLESLGPGPLDNAKVSELWDETALTQAEELVIDALRLVVGGALERIAVVGERSGANRWQGRRAIAKLDHSSTPIPLKRLGNGAQRLLGISLALANCQDGILLIDQVESGIHHSVLLDLWRMIFRAAERGNVQVVAATHSWDCIASFAAAAVETPADGKLYRLERVGDDLHAVHYSEEDLEVAAQQRIEVR